MSHAASDLTTAPLINGSIVFAVLVSIGLLSVLFARARKLIESKDVVMVCIFVLTAGFSMWIVWLSVWMVRDQWYGKQPRAGVACTLFSFTVKVFVLWIDFDSDFRSFFRSFRSSLFAFAAPMAPTHVPPTPQRRITNKQPQ